MWKDINENYEISIDGKVRNKKTQYVLKTYLASGYEAIKFKKGEKKHFIHHLVAKAFLPAPTETKVVLDHINRNKSNNHASNLRYVSRSLNCLNRTTELKPRITKKQNEHHHIYKNYALYYFKIRIMGKAFTKSFKELNDAIMFRDEYIKQNALSSTESP